MIKTTIGVMVLFVFGALYAGTPATANSCDGVAAVSACSGVRVLRPGQARRAERRVARQTMRASRRVVVIVESPLRLRAGCDRYGR